MLVFFGGASTSLIATFIVYPFDNLRLRKQTDNKSRNGITIFRQTIENEGIKGIFKGI